MTIPTLGVLRSSNLGQKGKRKKKQKGQEVALSDCVLKRTEECSPNTENTHQQFTLPKPR